MQYQHSFNQKGKVKTIPFSFSYKPCDTIITSSTISTYNIQKYSEQHTY